MEDKIRSALVNWSIICRANNQAGLEVLNLEVQNKATVLKNLHKLHDSWIFLASVNMIWESYYNDGRIPHTQWTNPFGGKHI